MANNISVKDSAAVTQTIKTTDTAGIHTPHNNVDAVIPGTGATNLGKAEDAAHANGDTGIMALAVRRDTAASNVGTDGDYSPLHVTSDGSLRVDGLRRASTATLSNVNDAAVSTTILASNAARLGATVYNDSTVALYLKFGSSASTTSFTVKLAADQYYEVPFGYTGILTGIWASDAAGAARVTELTA